MGLQKERGCLVAASATPDTEQEKTLFSQSAGHSTVWGKALKAFGQGMSLSSHAPCPLAHRLPFHGRAIL